MTETNISTRLEPPANDRVEIIKVGESRTSTSDLITLEEPLEIQVASGDRGTDESISITMRTPGNDFELAVGFLFAEGIIKSARDVVTVEHCGPPSPDRGIHNTVKVTLAEGVSFDTSSLSRHVFTSSSCGICGKASLEAISVQLPSRREHSFAITAETLQRLPERLQARQAEFSRTGGLHAAGLFTATGEIRRTREDVGRHNALDKLVGSLVLGDESASELGLLLSGRMSFELIQKAAMAAIPLVAAIGPPSSLAVDLAVSRGMTLVGFLRADRFNIYTSPERVA